MLPLEVNVRATAFIQLQEDDPEHVELMERIREYAYLDQGTNVILTLTAALQNPADSLLQEVCLQAQRQGASEIHFYY